MSEVELNEVPQTGGYSVTLPTFEGPLDLLLHLCQKHELDVLDIPIGFVTEKYLEYLAVMQLMNLDVASEYLVMAATLAHIKSKMLLPAPPPGQEDEVAGEEEDPREALIKRLLEYQKYKQAGEDLAARGVAGQDVFLRGMPIEEAVHTGLPPLAQVPLFSLVEAFQGILAKSSVKLSHDIVHERVTLADRINELVDILRVKRRVTFEELFEGLETRFDLVITFLALLEMTRLRMTRLYQEHFDAQIWIEFTAQVTADENVDPEAAAAANDAAEQAGGADTSAVAGSAFDTEVPPPSAIALEDIDDPYARFAGRDQRPDEEDEEALATGALDTEAPPPLPASEDDASWSADDDVESADEDVSAASTIFDVSGNEDDEGDATSTTQDEGARPDDDGPSGDEDT